MVDPLVTIVIPTYNRLWGLRDSILSVQKQTFENWNILVVDDAGTEPVGDFVESLRDPRIRYYRQTKNLGVAGNWKSGIEKVTTKYFSILMDDDWYGPNFLKNRLEIIDKNKSFAMVYGPYFKVNNGLHVKVDTRFKGSLDHQQFLRAVFSRDNFIGSSLFDTKVVQGIVNQACIYGLILDYPINVFTAYSSKKMGYCVDQYDFYYREHAYTVSNTNRELANEASYRFVVSFYEDNKLSDFKFFNDEIKKQLVSYLINSKNIMPVLKWAFRVIKRYPFSYHGYFFGLKTFVKNIAKEVRCARG